MKFSRREKILMWLMPYWCKHCKRRFRSEKKYQKHYLRCNYDYEMMMNEKLGYIAPRNRSERRKMAKKAGMIKDWKDLNG